MAFQEPKINIFSLSEVNINILFLSSHPMNSQANQKPQFGPPQARNCNSSEHFSSAPVKYETCSFLSVFARMCLHDQPPSLPARARISVLSQQKNIKLHLPQTSSIFHAHRPCHGPGRCAAEMPPALPQHTGAASPPQRGSRAAPLGRGMLSLTSAHTAATSPPYPGLETNRADFSQW